MMRDADTNDRRNRLAVIGVLIALSVVVAVPTSTLAAVTSMTQHGPLANSFDAQMSSTDLIQGKNTLDTDVYINPVDSFGHQSNIGWHPVNTDPLDQLAAFTDGIGMRSTGLTGLLNDFPPASGSPTKIVEYPFATPVDIGRINIFSGNQNNADGRIFSTAYIEYSTDNGGTYQPIGYFQSDPSGSINDENNPVSPLNPPQKSTMLSVFDSSSSTLASGVTNIIFNLYSVGILPNPSVGPNPSADPYDGVNEFTNVDDNLPRAYVSPLILEIDVLPPQEGESGDYNGNLVVDAGDYVVWRKSIGAETLPNRVEGISGVVGTQDYNAWKARFGNPSGVGTFAEYSTSVPEPSSLCLAIGMLIGWTLAIRSRSVLINNFSLF